MKLLEKPKIITEKYNIKLYDILECLIYFASSFALSASKVAGGVCPFALSLISVSNKKNFLFSSAGAILGYILFSSRTDAARYFASVIICALGSLSQELFKLKKEPYLPMVLSFMSVISTGFVMLVRLGSDGSAYLLLLGESVLCAGGAFFFFKAVNCNFTRLKFKAAPVSDITCVIICASVILMGLERLTIFSVSPARIIAVFLIISTLRFGSEKWGITLAISLGFAMGLGDEGAMFILGAWSLSALLASLFSSLSSVGTGIAFSLSTAFFSIFSNAGSMSLGVAIESVIASAILALMPSIICDKISEFWEKGADTAPEGSLRQSLVVRLRFASSAMSAISESVKDVRMKIEEINGRKGLSTDPIKSDLRMVAADQFFSISDMLSDLAFEFDEAESFDRESAGKIRRILGESQIYPKNISVVIDKFDRMRIEIITESNTVGLKSPRIKTQICRICARNFEAGRITHFGDQTMLAFCEKPSYKLSIGFSQHSAEGKLCGDTIKVINDSRGHSILIISDGMGRGPRAALDGAMGAGLLSKLISAGFGFDSSLKVVNSALLVKSDEESLATLDCASIDLFTGKCEFYKAGAPRSYIKKGEKMTVCELASMPAGILRGIEFAKRTTILGRGDILIMLSDGITDVGEEWLDAFVSYSDEMSEQELADNILDFAKKNTNDNHRDDMSVIVARLVLN